ncbi:uncharacterized protein BDW43DRAFT_255651 [Aspergillus alliaceus]|uniref:uncharacterized protein n=1 Tax=Petromyces alliaceus TaxID=209559 RepID=UPI0012A70376|nr:uncharacterized protein BDW43DRAFT_255651 [Aspergillus alliaceus]KAB8227240.1 hypothetical protein BDW43DRAFT_255651 [Aspergillus alliaceus]
MEGFTSYHLQDITCKGPQGHKRPPYASIAILDPIITIEKRHGKYHIAARFNIETAILDYASRNSDGRELFFQDICLQYRSPWDNENLLMKPESDPTAALTVSRGFTSSTSATVGATASQTPSGNVSLGLTRSKSLTVEYAMTSWSLSAHCVVNDGELALDDDNDNAVRYQWFWAGTQDESRRLSSDLRHAVKRHVVVKRIVSEEAVCPLEDKPKNKANSEDASGTTMSRPEDDDEDDDVEENEDDDDDCDDEDEEGTDNQERNEPHPTQTKGASPENPNPKREVEHESKHKLIHTWKSLLEFNFSVQIRVKKRLSRLQRFALFTSNDVRGRYLRPVYTENFGFEAPPLKEMIPSSDTADISTLLNQIKKDVRSYPALLPCQ